MPAPKSTNGTLRKELADRIQSEPGVTGIVLRKLASALGCRPDHISKMLYAMVQSGTLRDEEATFEGKKTKAYFRTSAALYKKTRRPKPVAKAAKPAKPQPGTVLPETTKAPSEKAPPRPVETDDASLVLLQGVDRLATDLAERLASYVAQQVVLRLNEALGSLAESLPAPGQPLPPLAMLPAAPSKPRKKRVLIIGLLPQQAGLVSTEFGEALDLSFAGADDNVGKIKAQAAQAGEVLAMTKFISHSCEDLVKAHPGYSRVAGGMSALRDKLTAIFGEKLS